jgi:hypothetical protein
VPLYASEAKLVRGEVIAFRGGSQDEQQGEQVAD